MLGPSRTAIAPCNHAALDLEYRVYARVAAGLSGVGEMRVRGHALAF